MPQIPQIGDSTGKSYSTTLGNNRGSSGGEQQFTVDGSQKPEQLQVVSDKNAGNNAQTTMGQKDLIPLAVTVSKNQALAVETVKDIINADLLNTAKLNGYTELAGDLENLSSSLYIPADRLLEEMLEQENQNTMFINDEFYDLLREASVGANSDLKEAIGNMLKAINFSQNKEEITSALSSNLKFLAEYFSPNRVLSERLSGLAERWASGEAPANFAELRDETSELLKNVSDSLLNDSHTQTLLPIVIHNISKYNTNSGMLREYFGQLLTQIPSYELRNELSNAFEALLGKLFRANSPEQEDGQTTPLYNYTINEEKNQVEISFFSKENGNFLNFSEYLSKILTNEEFLSETGLDFPDFSDYVTVLHRGEAEPKQVISDLLSQLLPDGERQEVVTQKVEDSASMRELVNFLNEFLEAMPAGELRNSVYDVLEEAINVLAEQKTLPEEPPGETQEQNAQAAQNGQAAQTDQTGRAVQQNMPEQAKVPDKAYQAGQEYPAGQAEQAVKSGQAGKQSSSIQALTDFVAKNINHPALKSIDSFNASNLLQSMINAPGVMTPLSHFILPIQVEDTRAFGELWVDNDDDDEPEKQSRDGKKNYHMFLTFDVDAFGRFETDVYARGNTLSVSLLHPPGFGKNIDQMINKINRIAAGSGYAISSFETGVLKTPRNLVQVFPKLIERRTGLNVQA